MRFVLAASLLLLASACSDEGNVVNPPSFVQPGAIAFVCFDLDRDVAVSLSGCGEGSAENFQLHALVTQTTRGEIAAVNLLVGQPIDSNVTVPGFTYLATGELPVDVVVPKTNPQFAYVINSGNPSITTIPLERFLAVNETNVNATMPLSEFGAPVDAILSPAEDLLVVAVPDRAGLLFIPITDGALGTPELVSLMPDVPAPTAASSRPAYCRACADGGSGCDQIVDPFLGEAAFAARVPVNLGDAPRPVALEWDPVSNLILVADENRAVIHRVDPTLKTSTAISVGVPTRGLALTPPVPDVVQNSTTVAQYLYAIDAIDGSVLAIDYLEGTVLPVALPTEGARDRIALAAPARVVSIATPGLASSECAEDAPGLSSTNLHGVFLVVGTQDGTAHIIDVHDLNVSCRGEADCSGSGSATEEFFVHRHRPRLSNLPENNVSLVGSVVFSSGAVVGEPDDEGTAPGIPFSMSVQTCELGAASLSTVLCAAADPWVARSEDWAATYGGVIPGTAGRVGILRDGNGTLLGPLLEGEVRFCDRGVMGAEGNAAIAPENAHRGDILSVLGPLPPNSTPACQARFLVGGGGEGGTDELLPLEFAVRTSYSGALTLADEGRVDADGVTFAEVLGCFVEAVDYEIRSGAAFAVIGTVSGFSHRVMADDALPGEPCRVDETLPATRQGRAVPGVRFDNGRLQFELSAREGMALVRDSTIELELGQVPGSVALDMGILPAAIVYESVPDRLYTIDVAGGSVREFTISPINAVREFR